MCLVCIEVMKGKLTLKEARRNLQEIAAPHTETEIQELYDFVEKNRPDLMAEMKVELLDEKREIGLL